MTSRQFFLRLHLVCFSLGLLLGPTRATAGVARRCGGQRGGKRNSVLEEDLTLSVRLSVLASARDF